MTRKLRQVARARERAEALRRQPAERGLGAFDYLAVLAIVAAIVAAWSQVL